MGHKKIKAGGLNRFLKVRSVIIDLLRAYYVRGWKMDLHPTCQFSMTTKFDKTYPKGVHVGENSYVAFETRILCHDRTRGLYLHTRIGKNCFIGGSSLILPGIEIGDGCVVGAGSVVTKSVPSGCVVAGNPAKILREGIEVGPYGRFVDADARESALVEQGA